MTTRGLLPGRFMPPHAGHVAAGRMAAALVDELTVMIFARPGDPVPGSLRAAWMRELLPQARIVQLDSQIPPDPGDDPDAGSLWRAAIREAHPRPIDRLFGSDPGLARLARDLGAAPVPVDPDRRAFPVSGAALRADPAGHWRFLPGPVRPWYQKRVVTFGAESTGKSVLARRLADWLAGPLVPEYGRAHEAVRGDGPWSAAELIELARRHEAHRAAIAPWAGPVLVEDTDPLLTAVWARMLLDAPVPELEARPRADLYLLLDAEVPFVQDGIRYFDGAARRRFQDFCEEVLARAGARAVRIAGDWQAREAAAREAVETLRAEPFPGRWALPPVLWPLNVETPGGP